MKRLIRVRELAKAEIERHGAPIDTTNSFI